MLYITSFLLSLHPAHLAHHSILHIFIMPSSLLTHSPSLNLLPAPSHTLYFASLTLLPCSSLCALQIQRSTFSLFPLSRPFTVHLHGTPFMFPHLQPLLCPSSPRKALSHLRPYLSTLLLIHYPNFSTSAHPYTPNTRHLSTPISRQVSVVTGPHDFQGSVVHLFSAL